MNHDVAVIGAGVIGAAIAWHLTRRGATVALLDRAPGPARAPSASWASAGGLRSQGRSAPERPLAMEAARRWPALSGELCAPLGFEQGGHLHLAETEAEAEHIAARVTADRACGIAIDYLDGASIRALCPGVTARAIAGAFTAHDGKAHPARVAGAFARAAQREGATLTFGAPCRLSQDTPGQVRLIVDERPLAAGAIVVATGAWSVDLLASIGLELPLRWRGLQMLLSDVALPALGATLTAQGRNLSLKQTAAGQYMIGGRWTTMPPDGAAVAPTSDGESAARQWSGAAAVWPALAECRLAQIWAGAEAQTPDAAPLIGRAGPPGLWLATGFSGHGFQIAPEVGRLLALALDGVAQPLLAPFDPARFHTMAAAERAAFLAAP